MFEVVFRNPGGAVHYAVGYVSPNVKKKSLEI